MGTYRLSEEAKDDLIHIHQFGIRTFGESQADSYFWQLIQAFEQIAQAPLMYQAVPDIREGYRRCVSGAHAIYYRVEEEQVEIMAILRSQDPKGRLSD